MVDLSLFGYVAVGDLLAIHPQIAEIVDEAEEAAKILNMRGVTLQKEAESKMVTAKDYQDSAQRKLQAVAKFRQAVGETKKK